MYGIDVNQRAVNDLETTVVVTESKKQIGTSGQHGLGTLIVAQAPAYREQSLQGRCHLSFLCA